MNIIIANTLSIAHCYRHTYGSNLTYLSELYLYRSLKAHTSKWDAQHTCGSMMPCICMLIYMHTEFIIEHHVLWQMVVRQLSSSGRHTVIIVITRDYWIIIILYMQQELISDLGLLLFSTNEQNFLPPSAMMRIVVAADSDDSMSTQFT